MVCQHQLQLRTGSCPPLRQAGFTTTWNSEHTSSLSVHSRELSGSLGTERNARKAHLVMQLYEAPGGGWIRDRIQTSSQPCSGLRLIAAPAGFYTRFALYAFTPGRIRGG